MKLTAEQTEDLPFPVGCPVWYGFSEGKDGGGAPQLLKEGVVDSVSFDVISKDMVYVVTYDDGKGTKVVDDVPEKNLAYAANCPVTISSHDKESAEGTVLLCEPVAQSNEEPRKLLYTAMVSTEGCRARYESGIERGRLKFRRVAKLAPPENVVAQKEQPAANLPADSSLVGGEVVPSSITCDSVTKSSHSKEGSKREASGGSSQASNTAKKPRVESGPSFTHHHQNEMSISIPPWLQRHRGNLFGLLIGSRKENRPGVNQIGQETECTIHVKRDNPQSMVIQVKAMCTEATASKVPRNLRLARLKITDLLLQYLDLDRDGAKGRLSYDISVQCRGAHRPNNSKNRAVNAKNPFNGRIEWMTVVELPYEVYKDRREYHGSYLQDRRFLDHIRTNKGCSITLVGDEFGIPTRRCKPYVLVTAASWEGVDWGANAVKSENRRHMDKCVCRLR
ncbi:hypothetical protein ACHAXT_001461 [Thalassiosira profunda]